MTFLAKKGKTEVMDFFKDKKYQSINWFVFKRSGTRKQFKNSTQNVIFNWCWKHRSKDDNFHPVICLYRREHLYKCEDYSFYSYENIFDWLLIHGNWYYFQYKNYITNKFVASYEANITFLHCRFPSNFFIPLRGRLHYLTLHQICQKRWLICLRIVLLVFVASL